MMAYHPTSDQVELAASMGESLASILPLSRLRESQEENAETWSALRELGVFAISTPEARGGSGLGALEEALITIELGRRAASPSVLATLGASVLEPQDGRVAAGYRRASRVFFVHEAAATRALIREGERAALFAALQPSRVVDEHLWSSRLCEAHETGPALTHADAAQALRLRLLDAAALAGLARAALDMSVEYAALRQQFGHPIGSFQAVKHHCANMAMGARLACDQVAFAALAIDGHSLDAALQVESALLVAGTAALESCGKNIQVHGGIGFSEEALPHHLLKRTRVLLEIAGGLEAATARVASCAVSEP